jgi:hypothetical protein
MRRIIPGLILVLLSTGTVSSQEKPVDVTHSLEKLFGRLTNNYNDDDRLRINDSIRMIIDRYVESDSAFTHRFRNLKYLGQIKPPNSQVKIITWNLVLRNSPGRYYSYLIRKEGQGEKNKVYKLMTEYNEDSLVTDTTYHESNWYGALYYDLKPYIIDNDKYWILLGIDYGNPDISRKIIEVLSFTPGDSLIFGKRLFNTGKEFRYREVFEYASTAMMSLRFRNDSTIVFDHLVPFSPAMQDNRQYYGPDYSFDAYQLKKTGLWQLEINVDVRNEE